MLSWCLQKSSWIALLFSTLAGFFMVGDSVAHEERLSQSNRDNLQYWFDSSGQSEFNEAQKHIFQSIPKRSISFGYTQGTLWLRLQLPAHPANEPMTYWLELDSALLSTWQVFVPGQTAPVYEAGLSRARAEQNRHRSPIYRIDLPAGQGGTWYIKARSDYAISLNPQLHTIRSLGLKEKNQSFLLGAYAGVMLFAYVLTLYIFLRTRHLNFLYYSFLLLSFHIFYQFSYNHVASLYLWPDSPWWSNRASVFLGETAHFFGAIFVRDTLQTRRFTPRLDLIIRWVPLRSAFFIAWAVLDLSPNTIKYEVLTSVVMLFLYYGLGLYIWTKGHIPARYFSTAWLPVLIGNAMVFVQDLNIWVASSAEWQEAIRFQFPMLGAAIQAILLGIAVGDQFRRIQKEQNDEHLAREKLEQSLDAAHNVQDAFIRTDSMAPRYEIRSSHQMSAKIGGDWLGYAFDERSQRLLLAISDVTGHGLPSALLTSALHGAFYGLAAAEPIQSLEDAELLRVLMDRLDHVVRTTAQKTGLMATMALVCINLETFHISYYNAGHTPILVSGRAGQHFMLKGGSPLGISDEPSFGHDSWQAEAGDIVFLFTDGLLDQTDTGQRNHLKTIAQQIRPDMEIDSIHQQIEQMIHRHHLTLEDDSSYLLCRLLAA